jgi:3-hydroxyisobutyrate dehydrogenase
MGGPMAGHLVRAGYEVTVWNRTPAKAEPLRHMGAEVAKNLAALAPDQDAIFLCVSRSEDVEACLEQLLPNARSNTIFVDHSTIAPDVAKRLGAGDFHFVDAPITGGSMGAINGTLTIFCGGTEEDFSEVEPILAAYGRRVAHVGPSGAGQMMKMVNQIAVGGALMALCESLAFAAKAGLDLGVTKELVGSGAGGSWAFENYGPKILNQDWTPGFSVINQRKDFGYCRQAAAEIGAVLPGTEVVDRLLAVLEQDGRGQDTTAALYEVLLELTPAS